ncbi:hypothetical protein [Streptomyces sp. AC555_RSS877]|uniref:hypothetical protein n=1 Tax=Streptomyces sp. AC555_RSS877 TaxID=2823688 RepID=UPI0020B7B025|nr:hypothetical protein [Streptomyces sp. AC555_RSS877]
MEVPEEVADAPVAPVTPVNPTVAPRPRRRGRTALLIAGAAVLGLVAGTCAGYLVQADREPTKLPSLSQPTLPQAKGKDPEPLSAARDRRVRTDGDLRKLLLKKPGGAKDADWLSGADGWMDLAAYADLYNSPDDIFGDLVGDEFRRAAVTGWESGTSTLEIRLIQFRQEEAPAAADTVDDSQYWADAEDATESWTVPGTGNGMAYVHTEPEREAGYLPLYSAEAHAWRGDIVMEIWMYDTKPISKKKIMGLAERQMERL